MNKLELVPSDFLVLVVDDTEANVKLLSHVLKAEGYNIMVAFNGEDALEVIEARKPDLILLDVMMPYMSGYEVSIKINEREEFDEVPIIFLSALSDTNNKVEGFEAGGVDYITKPFQKEEVLARLKSHLYLSKLQKERKERIRELKEREIQLNELNVKKDDLIRMVSHDIKNPLVGIVGLTKLINERPEMGEAQKKEMLEAVEKSGKKLLDMVEETLDNFTASSNLEMSNFNPFLLADRIISVNKPKALLKEIELQLEGNDDSNEVELDESKIEVILNNLVSNALKFTLPNGKVTIGIKFENKDLIMTVEDNGVGIDEDKINSLFSHRKNQKRDVVQGTSGEKGTGLGLDVIHKYVYLHNGSIWVESKMNEGTKFYIKLPIKYEANF